MKNSIYVGSNTSASVVANAIVPLTTIVHRENGNNSSEINLVSNSVVIETGCRYRPRYNIDVAVTFTGVATGTASLAIYKNGILIPFTTKSETIGTANTEIHTITIPCGTLTDKCSDNVYTIVNVGTIGLTVTNASMNVVEQ